MHEIDKIREAAKRIPRGVIVTVIATQGSTYRRAGARVAISEDGKAYGAISGGCLERDLAERIRPWLDEFTPRLVTYDSTRADDVIFGLGLGCRGIVDLLIEPFDSARPPRLVTDFRWNGRAPVEWSTHLPNGEELVEIIQPQRAIAIFGAGADVEPVAQLAHALGWSADVIAPRKSFDANAYDAAIVMTHNYMLDVDILRALLASPVAYIGLLGPKTRGDELLAEIAATRDERIHSPIGLDLGAETPEEIALSIIAEVQAVLAKRSAQFLRDVDGPIHAPAGVNTTTCA
ncbi:MAG TPA: XdhC family protein [Thermoanaerobaculia bacterium]|nr:XdhC family protein [Thermoanaerobaculia bacterium]